MFGMFFCENILQRDQRSKTTITGVPPPVGRYEEATEERSYIFRYRQYDQLRGRELQAIHTGGEPRLL
jgi:hypothetical protein